MSWPAPCHDSARPSADATVLVARLRMTQQAVGQLVEETAKDREAVGLMMEMLEETLPTDQAVRLMQDIEAKFQLASEKATQRLDGLEKRLGSEDEKASSQKQSFPEIALERRSVDAFAYLWIRIEGFPKSQSGLLQYFLRDAFVGTDANRCDSFRHSSIDLRVIQKVV